MFEELKRIFRHSFVYGLGAIFSKLVGFLMIPVYTRCLTTKDYGVIELIGLSMDMICIAISLGIRESVIRFYYDVGTPKERNQVISTSLWYMAVLGGVITAFLLILSKTISRIVLGQSVPIIYLQLTLVSNYMELMTIICLNYFRAKELSVVYSAILVARLLLALSLNIIMVVTLKMGVMGIILSTLISSSVVFIFCNSWTVREVGLSFSMKQFSAQMRYGLPLVPASLAMFSLQFSDRFFLRHFSDMSSIGVYSLAYKFSLILSFLLTEPFWLAWSALMFPIAKRDDSESVFSQVLTIYTLTAFFLGLGISLLVSPVIRIMSTPSFYRAEKAVPVLILGFIALGIFYVLNTGVYVTKKTSYCAVNVGAAAIINLILNRLLVPQYGMLGAAWATSLSFITLSLVSWLTNQAVYPVHYNLFRQASIVEISVLLYLIGIHIPVYPLWSCFLFRSLLTLLMPIALYALGFFTPKEKIAFYGLLHGIRRFKITASKSGVNAG